MLIRLVARLMGLAIVHDDEQGDRGCRVTAGVTPSRVSGGNAPPSRVSCDGRRDRGTMTAWPFDLLGRAERSSPNAAPCTDIRRLCDGHHSV
jgi:hypothetical protein